MFPRTGKTQKNNWDWVRVCVGWVGNVLEGVLMGILDRMTTGRSNAPPRIILYGQEGIGKTEWASSCPAPVIQQTEDGAGEVPVTNYRGEQVMTFGIANNLAEINSNILGLISDDHDRQTYVLDGISGFEALVRQTVCKESNVTSIEKAAGGYGKGFTMAAEKLRHTLGLLNRLCVERGMIIVVLGHAEAAQFNDPDAVAYDRWNIRGHKGFVNPLVEWAYAVLFAKRKFIVKEDESARADRNVVSGVGKDGGDRILITTGSPNVVAKNRYHLPATMPMPYKDRLSYGWEEFEKHYLASR